MAPGVPVNAAGARSKVVAALAALPVTTTNAHSALVEELTAFALAGRDLPGDIVDRLAADRIQAEAVAEARTVLSEVIQRVNAAGVDAAKQRVPALLSALDTRVREIQAEVVDLMPRLAGVRSAAEAMRAGDDQVAAWRRLLEFENEYAQIRQQQGVLSTSVGGTRVQIDAAVLAKFGLIRNVAEVWPAVTAVAIGRTGPRPPWPHPEGQPWLIRHDLEFLLWAAGSVAQLWVPTPAQLDEAFDAARLAGNSLRSDDGPRVRRQAWTGAAA